MVPSVNNTGCQKEKIIKTSLNFKGKKHYKSFIFNKSRPAGTLLKFRKSLLNKYVYTKPTISKLNDDNTDMDL